MEIPHPRRDGADVPTRKLPHLHAVHSIQRHRRRIDRSLYGGQRCDVKIETRDRFLSRSNRKGKTQCLIDRPRKTYTRDRTIGLSDRCFGGWRCGGGEWINNPNLSLLADCAASRQRRAHADGRERREPGELRGGAPTPHVRRPSATARPRELWELRDLREPPPLRPPVPRSEAAGAEAVEARP